MKSEIGTNCWLKQRISRWCGSTTGSGARHFHERIRRRWKPHWNHHNKHNQPCCWKESKHGIDLKSGRDIKVKVEYDGLNQLLSVSLGYAENPLVSFLNHSITMSDIVPRSVYVGFTASTGTLSETHQVRNWVFTSVPLSFAAHETGAKTEEVKTILFITIPVSIGLSIVLSCIFLLVLRSLKRNKRRKKEEDIESRSRTAANVPKMFTYKELLKATNGFSKENLLGKGGFGSVYKGTVSDHPPKTIAVKKISSTSDQGLPCSMYLLHTW